MKSLLPQNPRYIHIDGTTLGGNMLNRIPITESAATIFATTAAAVSQAATGHELSSALVHASLTGIFCLVALKNPNISEVINNELAHAFGSDWKNRTIDKKGNVANSANDIDGAEHATITFNVSSLIYATAGVGAMYLDHCMQNSELGGSPFNALAAVGNAAVATASVLLVHGLRCRNVAKDNWSIVDTDVAEEQMERDRVREEKTRLNRKWSPQPAAVPIPVNK